VTAPARLLGGGNAAVALRRSDGAVQWRYAPPTYRVRLPAVLRTLADGGDVRCGPAIRRVPAR
jgi:hypothetical protein